MKDTEEIFYLSPLEELLVDVGEKPSKKFTVNYIGGFDGHIDTIVLKEDGVMNTAIVIRKRVKKEKQ